MTTVLTGSKGFLGRALMSALPDAVGLDLPECDVRVGCDYPKSVGDALDLYPDKASTVWHLAALNGSTQGFYDRPWDVLHTQIAGTLNVIDACVANGVKTLVLFSSSEVFQAPPVIPTPESVPFSIPDMTNPRFSYAASKQAAEMMAWYSAIPRVVILRPFNVYGPGQKEGHAIADLVARIGAAERGATVPVYGNPGDTRAYCHIDDFVAGALTAERLSVEPREVYHVGSEQETAMALLVTYIAQSMGRADVKLEFQGGPPGGVTRRCPDTRKLRALGWEPTVNLADGLHRTVEAWREAQK